MNLVIKKIILSFITLISLGIGHAQTTDDIKKEADDLFKNEQFIEATPLYLQLLNVEPRNHELNFKYGTCLIYSAQDKSEAIRFLSFSVKNPGIDQLAYFYLGKAYHLNFEFTKALTYYNKFESVAPSNDKKKYSIDANISACRHGRQLLTNITDMIVIEKKEVKKEDFYELYKLDDIGGSLLVTDQFQTKYDKKVGHRPIIYFPQDSPYIFYSSYGEDGKTGLDIYVKQKLPNGKWSEAIKVVGDVNTVEDEDFPYLSADGKYLYYSSKGHNSMGGYDVFRSKVIIEGSSFSSPENMDFAISSPNDDILYIVDSLDRTAYFSSARESQDGKLYVYKVRVEKIPMRIAVIKGTFINTIDPGNRELEIIVNNAITGEQIGEYHSKGGSGDVLLTIPKSGKYKFTMNVAGSDIYHLGEVTIPHLNELRPLKMNFTHEYNDQNLEVIRVNPLFDERFDDPSEVMADVFQKMSKLSPNASQFDLDSLDKLKGSDDIYEAAGIDIYATPEDVEDIITKSIEDIKAEIAKNEVNSNIAHNLAQKKQNEAEAKMAEAKVIIATVESETDEAAKKDQLTKAYKFTQQAIALNKEAVELVEAGEKIETEIDKDNKKLIASNEALIKVKSIEQTDRAGLTSFVTENTEILAEATSKTGQNILDILEEEGDIQKKEKNEILKKIADLEERERQLKSEEIALNETLINTKKKKDKPAIESKIQEVKSELELIQDEIVKNQGKLDRFEGEGVSNIDLADVASAIKDSDNQTEENKAVVSNTQKLKIKYLVEDETFKSDVIAANDTFEENDIVGEYASLSGLNETLINAREFTSVDQFEEEINKLQKQLDNSIDAKEKKQIEDLIKELEQLKANVAIAGTDSTTTSEISKDDLVENYSERRKAIDQIAEVDKRKDKEYQINQTLSEEIEKAIKDKEKELKSNPDDEKLVAQVESLKTLEEETNKELKAYDEWKSAQKDNKGKSDFTYEDALTNANPDYENKVNEIYNNTELNDEEKAEEVKTLNEVTQANAEERLQEVEALLSQNVNDSEALDEKKHLDKLIDELENNKTVPLVEPQLKQEITSVDENVEPDQLVEDYQNKLDKIEASAINDIDKEKAKMQINNSLLTKINNEIATLNEAIENKAENSKTFKKRVENLEELKTDIEDDVETSEAIIKELEEENPDLANSVESIFPNYTSKSYEINELTSDEEKKAAIKVLNEEAIAAIEVKKKELKIANATNPRDELKFSINELEDLTEALEKNIEDDYYGVVVFEEDGDLSKIKSNVSVYDIMPDLDERVSLIEEQAISKKDLEKKKVDLNEEIISKIDQEIRKLENAKNIHPNNEKQLTKRIENLQEIKVVKQNEINASKSIIGEEFIEYNIVVKVEDANPDYQDEMSHISAIEDTEDKTKAIEELNQKTVQLIEDKVKSLEADLAVNSGDRKTELLIKKYKEMQAQIEANPELPVAEAEVSDNNDVANIDPSDTSTGNDSGSDSANVEFPVIYEETTLNEIIPDYDSKIATIQNSSKPQIEIEKDKIALYNKSLDKLELEIKELETYLRIESPNKSYAEKKIQNIQEIEAVLISEREKSQDIINNSTADSDVIAGISDIMPDYETRKEKIDYASTSEIDKKQRTNELNKVLLFEIDKEQELLEDELKENPSLDTEESIEKLEELREAIQNEIDINNEYLDSVDPGDATIAEKTGEINPLDPANFGDLLAEEKKELIAKDLEIIDNLENEIEELERRKARLTDKEAKKLEKPLRKLKEDKSELQNRLVIDLEPTIDEGLNEALKEAKASAVEVKSTGQINDDIRNANEGVEIAEEKIITAKGLRAEAEETKSEIISNDLLMRAAVLEYEAKEILEKSNRTFRSAIVINSMVETDEVVMKVAEDEADRKSTQLYDLADELEAEAARLEMRSIELKDSVETVKKKFRQAIIDDIAEIDLQAEELRIKVDDLRYDADELAEQEELIAEAIPSETVTKEVSNIDQLTVLKTDDYQSYFEEKTAADESFENAIALNKKIKQLKSNAERKIRMAIVEGQDVTEESLTDNEEINEILLEIDSLTKLQQQYKDEAIQHYQSAKQILDGSQESENVKENMVAMASQKIAPETNITLTGNDVADIPVAQNTPQGNEPTEFLEEASTDFIPPTELNGQIFRKTDRAVYSRENPIPVDAKQPRGLVYKVQVGAFRNALPPEYFNKFAPISGQALNNGVTRYMVGYFTNFVPADQAKTEIHGIGGYDDAFVVAYLNGERISISEARAIEESGIIPGVDPFAIDQGEPVVDNNPVNTPVNNTQVDNTTPDENITTQQDNSPVQPDNSPNAGNTPVQNTPVSTSGTAGENYVFEAKSATEIEAVEYYTSEPDAAPANQVEIISGLFYTVQVGVYSQPVPKSELFDISPLNSQLTETGKIRYSSGIYISIEDAAARKQELIELGLVDAFVTAYYNGERITIAESKNLLAEKGDEILVSGKTISEVNNEPAARFNKANVYYRILIGKYENFIPSNVVNYLFNDDSIFFDTEIDIDNNIFLYTQKFFDLSDVKKRLVEINELGFENMKIISYYNIQVIPFGEAANIINGTQVDELTEYDVPEGISADDIFYEADAIYYRINFGVYENVVPNDIMVTTSEITEYEIEQETDVDGNIVLHTSNIDNFADANAVLNRVVGDIPGAKVEAFHKYVQISVEKAQEIKGR